jgi:hypothetical protein
VGFSHRHVPGLRRIIIAVVDGLELALARELEQRCHVLAVQRAAQRQAPVDPHADTLSQQLLGPHGRTKLPGFLGGMRDLMKAVLDALRGHIRINTLQFLLDRGSDLRVP